MNRLVNSSQQIQPSRRRVKTQRQGSPVSHWQSRRTKTRHAGAIRRGKGTRTNPATQHLPPSSSSFRPTARVPSKELALIGVPFFFLPDTHQHLPVRVTLQSRLDFAVPHKRAGEAVLPCVRLTFASLERCAYKIRQRILLQQYDIVSGTGIKLLRLTVNINTSPPYGLERGKLLKINDVYSVGQPFDHTKQLGLLA